MKIIMLLFTFSFILISCDAPVRTRVPSSGTFNDDIGVSEIPDSYNDNNDSNNDDNNNDDDDVDNNNTNDEPGFQHCEFLNPQFNGGSIGYFGLCQNSLNERGFKAIFAESSTQGTCFVPINIASSGNSFKLGRAECVHNNADTNYFMTLNKELVPPFFNVPRPEAINGVMVLKATSLNAYMGCMNAKEDFFVGTQGCCQQQIYNPSSGRYNCVQPNPACNASANNYANNVCNLFVQNHSDNYRQVNF